MKARLVTVIFFIASLLGPNVRAQDGSCLSNVGKDVSDNDTSSQLTSMTNIILSISGRNILSETDSQVGFSLIRRALSYPDVRRDKEALVFCAEAIGSIRGVSTNAYDREMLAAYDADRYLLGKRPRLPATFSKGRDWGPNLTAFHNKWRPLLEHNRQVGQFRRKGVCELSAAIKSYVETFGKDTIPEFRRRIAELGLFTPEELSEIVGSSEESSGER